MTDFIPRAMLRLTRIKVIKRASTQERTMFIPPMGPDFPPILSILMTVFWIWMLIHCARNNTLSNKVWWILFIVFLQPIGGIVYFFARGPWPKVKKYLWGQAPSTMYQAPPIYQAPPAPQPRQDTYATYEQGYQAQQAPPASASQAGEQTYYTPSSLQPQYEQPEVPYPEPPQVQQ